MPIADTTFVHGSASATATSGGLLIIVLFYWLCCMPVSVCVALEAGAAAAPSG